ncbi:hypothetical protein ANN_15296 [Periplaneta americana]|uniref:Ig-like domain-containing protein n=1 Tax=Periplaneta americana TaxID=6978 RepID=A0ABQ8SGM7_PERAM|nr:hypothetical protein ANN_15296 [Periplaneta americana]
MFGARGAVIEHHAPYWEQPFSQPYFDNSTRREMTTTVGQSAYLHCRVRNLGDRAVSWIRKRDLHILTVGILTYTNDQRFQSLHSDGSDEWTLKVSSPQVRDSGTYECQVSTEPKISQAFRLNVVGRQNVHDEERSSRPTIITDDLLEQRTICLLIDLAQLTINFNRRYALCIQKLYHWPYFTRRELE